MPRHKGATFKSYVKEGGEDGEMVEVSPGTAHWMPSPQTTPPARGKAGAGHTTATLPPAKKGASHTTANPAGAGAAPKKGPGHTTGGGARKKVQETSHLIMEKTVRVVEKAHSLTRGLSSDAVLSGKEEENSIFHDDLNDLSVTDEELEPTLLQGEVIVSTARSVLCFAPYSEFKQGISGRLFCTNFRITFITADQTTAKNPSKQRNKLIGENDIALTSVDSVFQVSKGRKKRLHPSGGVSGNVKTLEIHSKDFRIHTFGFKFCPVQDSKTMVNAIVHHAFPTRLELLFAYDFKGNTSGAQ